MKSRAESLILHSVLYSLFIIIVQKCDYILSERVQKVPAIFLFGDSYGDTGNNDYIDTNVTGDYPPYGKDFKDCIPTGRISNGKLMSDYFAEGLGIKELLPPYLDPKLKAKDLLTGVCFSSSGTGLDNLTAQISNVIPVWKQIEYFKEYRKKIAGLVGEEEATTIINKAIFFISIGTNDFVVNYFSLRTRRLRFTVQEYTDFLLNIYTLYIKELYNLGATRLAVINVPPLGCLPIERLLGSLLIKGACNKKINKAADGFNSGLKAMIHGLKPAFPSLKIAYLDYHNLISKFIANPSKYDLEVIAEACCGTGTFEAVLLCKKFTPCTCADASKYLFFDSVHLTQKAYQNISSLFLTRDVPQLL
ncbi:GDSL esterase/lipase At2g42990-like [Cryptomeria japonica]|uniref:GDSL esterase/lipase At2g42990-like n=1 Tax=Cryptomeria japonica TaxID=3369 RepID=UPI0025AD3F8A|nr:GDSL esterase/lipase At2g42990-like [Cryptomeria japonica]